MKTKLKKFTPEQQQMLEELYYLTHKLKTDGLSQKEYDRHEDLEEIVNDFLYT